MKISALVAGLALMVSVSVMANTAQNKPNILFVMSDDHTSQAIGAYGGRLASLNPTPTIDSIAKEGVVMENAFCHNGICTPSRACIMTGQYSAINGCPVLIDHLPAERQYLSTEMNKAGYQTAVIGKWHLHDRPSTFDYYKVLPGQGYYFNPIFFEKGKTGTIERQVRKDLTRVFGPDAVEMEGHSTDCIADSALEWFKTKRDPDQPFFLKLHFKAPHDYFESAPRYESYLADTFIPEPENMHDRKKHGSIATQGHNGELIPHIGSSIGRRNTQRNYTQKWAKDPSLSDDEAMSQAYQIYLKRYLRCVKGVDDNLKRVVDYLKAEGLYDNTVIMYTGDQGMYLGEHDYQDKRWGYEEGMRMPFIVRYPKSIQAGSRTDAIVENVDFAPTMLDFAGVPTPDYMQGRSFKSVLETGVEPADWKKAAYYHYQMNMMHHDNPAHIAIRTKRYKLIMFYGTGWQGEDSPDTPPGWELYDLKNDLGEDHNLYDHPEYGDIISELKDELKGLRKKYKVDGSEFAYNKVIEEYWDYDAEARAKAIEISHQVIERIKNGTWPYDWKQQQKRVRERTRKAELEKKKAH
ncbi:sulfatase family protein [Pontiella sulfatireligans]|uniref:Arylsulfatase n=1 Tax=Pontiella sulfatireligans TaxID=2750658 RepID=A0A6C2UG54_9BACT|nr:sulfatase [Pontiella sulfatireligans]SPS74289.1 sulfatase S1_11 [Kiritimatiellales bacterium]VGO19098.1 Arylsulfatase [Pontiella sulfatireligans]